MTTSRSSEVLKARSKYGKLRPIPFEEQEAQSDWLMDQFDRYTKQTRWFIDGPDVIGIRHIPLLGHYLHGKVGSPDGQDGRQYIRSMFQLLPGGDTAASDEPCEIIEHDAPPVASENPAYENVINNYLNVFYREELERAIAEGVDERFPITPRRSTHASGTATDLPPRTGIVNLEGQRLRDVVIAIPTSHNMAMYMDDPSPVVETPSYEQVAFRPTYERDLNIIKYRGMFRGEPVQYHFSVEAWTRLTFMQVAEYLKRFILERIYP